MGARTRPGRARRGGGARARSPGQRSVYGAAARDRRSWPPHESVRAPAIVVVGPAAALHERRVVVARAPAASRPGGGGDPGARSGQRPGRRGSPGLGAEVVETPAIRIVPRLGDPDVAEAVVAHPRLRARLLHEPERRAASSSTRWQAAGAGRPCLRRGDGGGDRPRHRRRAGAATGSRPTWCRRARSPSRWSRRSGRCRWRGGPCSWRAPRRPATCSRRALPSAAGACERRGPLRHRGGAARRRDRASSSERATYVTFTSSSTVRFFERGPAAGCPAGARVVSIGPVTSATARRAGADRGRGGRAPRHRRPGGRRCWRTRGRGDRQPPHRLRPRRRVRGRLPRRDHVDRPRGRRSWT